MPQFVILTHDHPMLHWDLLLENGESCRTWRLLICPEAEHNEIPAEALPDHRLMYLTYEGPVSGDRGTVTRWDFGTFQWKINTPTECRIEIAGSRWQGTVRLEKIADRQWKLTREQAEEVG